MCHLLVEPRIGSRVRPFQECEIGAQKLHGEGQGRLAANQRAGGGSTGSFESTSEAQGKGGARKGAKAKANKQTNEKKTTVGEPQKSSGQSSAAPAPLAQDLQLHSAFYGWGKH